MRIAFLCLIASLTASAAVAQSAPEPAPPTVERQATAPKPPETRSGKLDWLFEQLKSTRDQELAKAIAAQIGAIFMDSESDTINLLMARALKAVNEKNLSLATDLLDQVVTLKPDYAEGWNKRATVFFLRDEYGNALADIEKVLALEPRHFGAMSGLGIIMGHLDDHQRAVEVFERVLQIYPLLDDVKEALDSARKELREREI